MRWMILGAGLSHRWLGDGVVMTLGPAPTSFGPVSMEARQDGDRIDITWDRDWHDKAPAVELRLPGETAVSASSAQVAWHGA